MLILHYLYQVLNYIHQLNFKNKLKYYNLYIDFDPLITTHEEISKILNLRPYKPIKQNTENKDDSSTWHYQIEENKIGKSTSFINIFLDILDPAFKELESKEIKKDDILFWLVYEYQHQCSMEFHPEEMRRLGKVGISLNIDCHQRS